MTLTKFLTRYNGQYVEEAGSTAPFQCVDLVNRYIREVLELPIIEWANAKDFPSKAGDSYDYILNTPEGVPQEGDLVIWGGTYGHIAIFIEGDSNSFRSFDENYPLGSPSHVQNHTNYNNVLGWLHPKNHAIIAQPIAQLTDQTKYDFGGKIGVLEMGAVRSTILDLKRDYDGAIAQAKDLARQLRDELEINRLLKLSNATLTQKIQDSNALIEDLTADLKECRHMPVDAPIPPDSLTVKELVNALLKRLRRLFITDD